jgi:hypothetical protein
VIAGDLGRDPPPEPNHNMKSSLLISLCLLPIAASLISCKPKGPAEKAGESVDEAIENVSDAVNPKGPLEKAGEKVDDALGK